MITLPEIRFLEEKISYDGTQLRPHFAYTTCRLQGDSIVAFRGACHVEKKHLVDLEDANAGLFIHSEDMLHFIVEHFQNNLDEMILLQRLLITHIIDEIHDATGKNFLIRRGNDIYDDTRKLSVSVATASQVSTLIHAGINISTRNTPVPTIGLEELEISPRAMAMGVMNRYRAEIQSVQQARSKVRGV